jgi:hypothetical protein
MRAYFNPFLPALGFCSRLLASNFRRGIPWQEQPGQGKETAADTEVGELDAYKVAVMLLVGAAIFSLF